MRLSQTTLIRALVSGEVACAEVFGERSVTLFAEEEVALRRVGPKRRRDFITSRYAARTALAHFGLDPAPLPPRSRRGPRWPDGIVGSITHCDEFSAAAVARADRVASLGIDAEPNLPLPPDVLRMIARPDELEMLAELDPSAGVCWDRLLFSAKEALYKAWSPLLGTWLGFDDAAVIFSASERAFRAHLRTPLSPNASADAETVEGRWGVLRGVIGTAIELAHAPGAQSEASLS
jgi:4'-phosphopantetheinyl transferase EntD